MPTPRPTPDDILHIARLEERRLATAVGALAAVSRPLAGGVLTRSTPGTFLNALFGSCLECDLDRSMLEEVIDFYAPHGIEPRVEIHPFLKPSSLAALAEMGFVVRSFDSVLYRRLDDLDDLDHDELPDGITIEPVDPTDDTQIDRFARASLAGFAVATSDIAEAAVRSMSNALRLPNTNAIVAMHAGEVVGAAAMETVGELTCLFGAAVTPALRGRGIQRAMIRWRLRAAADAGAHYATIGGAPGGPTERNVRRLGFVLAYIRTAFVRPGEGLRAIVE